MKKKLFVDLKENSYNILIEKGLLNKLGEELKNIYFGEKIFIITDENVDKYYGSKVKDELDKIGYKTRKMVLAPGEKTKSFSTLPSIYNELLDFKLTRKELIITLGGGVIGDLGGFAASTFLRGVSFIQIPTSLLAQVDSSVGGKVAVDLEKGKNLVGSFYQPKAVFIDPDVLNTLPEKFYKDGMAEVIKYGCIKDRDFFYMLKSLKSREEVMNNIEDILYKCCYIKKSVVERDEKDLGERMLLNFGHTLGHAIEKYYNFTGYSHGEAVAIGMYNISLKSEDEGITEKGVAEEIKEILINYDLPYKVDIKDNNKIIDTISLDKKNIGNVLKVILLKSIGESIIYDTTSDFFKVVR
ncbi:3-dehydroquinate synthase [Clostridium paraputrificum]|uniref:3-dehydroquinate synthase n=1 Tax=Clostridium paraputrificum TaxID=29363 RepID=A0A174UR78_9CLOT|nr:MULTISPECIES: 3-dehydroquinate synthase [Clostridium]MDB2090765.1 3-dehydroquinate synthase [Clostridium paraputrificum]MDB2097240.1 3-dehydroquinate synthase [Clostridium paraputrificum]MDB2103473.1 3-dehydroquinate synthase [Clostridium paraputrificum]MDU1180437.1 3-dehydroquinate synthase [Clostridium sp.]MDU1227760.1 3-dehydroquinate synthase [Clostridium sp.]